MHPHLRTTTEAFAAHFRADPRAVGLYLWGSGATGTADEWSDVDLALVVEDAAYEAVSAELRGLCQRLAGHIVLWFPEGRQPGYCNYAFLFEQDGERFLCDFAVMTRAYLVATPFRRPEKIVFDDAAGLLATLRQQRGGGPYVPAGLEYEIQHYWIYCYLNGKYWQRRDLFKLLYVQQTLLVSHLRLLRALHPDGFHQGHREWWPADVQRLPAEVRPALLRYFPAPDAASVRTALADEVSVFGAHARAAALVGASRTRKRWKSTSSITYRSWVCSIVDYANGRLAPRGKRPGVIPAPLGVLDDVPFNVLFDILLNVLFDVLFDVMLIKPPKKCSSLPVHHTGSLTVTAQVAPEEYH